MPQQSNTEIFLHHSNTYLLAFPNGPFQLAKWTVSRPKTDRFRTQKGMYCNPLIINVVQRRRNRWNNMNYLNNLLSLFPSATTQLVGWGLSPSSQLRTRVKEATPQQRGWG